MTIFGPDISSYEAGLNLSQLTAASFVIAKTTEGTYYHDADYEGWRGQARRLALPFIWYHFVTTEDAHAQVQNLLKYVGDKGLPGMLDVEPTGNYRAGVDDMLAVADVAKQAGLKVRLAYLPRWYHQELGSPSLTGLTARRIGLVSSAYPGGTGSPSRLYPGDAAAGWQAYGGVTPELYQFTDKATDGGKSMDYNAFRGPLADLLTLLGGNTMGTIPATIGQKWPEIASEFPANAQYDDSGAIIWADGGARAAALYAKEARDAVLALAAKIQQPPAVDVQALAAALAPLLQAGATADQIATAVVSHLATSLAKG